MKQKIVNKKAPNKKNNLNRTSANKNQNKKKGLEQEKKKELSPFTGFFIAIVCYAFVAFIFISTRQPAESGLVGKWVISNYGKKLIGNSLAALPLFFFLLGTSLLFTVKRWRTILTTILITLVAYNVFLSFYLNEIVPLLTWPLSSNGGGWLGNVILIAVHKVIGEIGTWILLGSIFLIAGLIIINFSVRIPIKRTVAFFIKLKSEFSEENYHKVKKRFIRKMIYFLFFRKVVISAEEKQRKRVRKESIQKTQEINFDLPNLEEEKEPIIPKQEPKPPKQQPEKVVDINSFEFYQLPPVSLLEKPVKQNNLNINARNQVSQERAQQLEEALSSFNVEAKVVNITTGPSVTRYELQPGIGVKISKITALSKDIALKLAAADVRIEAPIPGKALIGIEVPNPHTETITLQAIINKTNFTKSASKLLVALGMTITGEAVVMDLEKMPHLLIAGATGSGKSVCINAIILSVLMSATPEEVKFLMIDPKKVELSLYEGIPHLLAPVVTNPNKAAATLKQWALIEMEKRYDSFSKVGVKNIEGYNKLVDKKIAAWEKSKKDEQTSQTDIFPSSDSNQMMKKLPYIVVIIDELADLMMVASQEVENTICRLAQMSRATGIHLIIATQRPSVNVITGLIKANVPSRISFFLQSQIDSRTILDMPGAEKLLGKGDMLYSPVGSFKPRRLQGIFVNESEVKRVVEFLKRQKKPDYLEEIEQIEPLKNEKDEAAAGEGQDDLFEEAKNIVLNTRHASTSYLQRKLRIGYNRAARLMEELEEQGIVSAATGEKKARSVL